jgi:hypothetical protein
MSLRRVLVAVCVGVGLLATIWFLIGDTLARKYLKTMSQDWVSFEIPSSPDRLDLTFSRDPSGVTVCNTGATQISDLLVRINKVYVAQLAALQNHQCETVPISKFKAYTWKRIPATAGMQIETIEAVGTVSQRRYSRTDLTQSSPGNTPKP